MMSIVIESRHVSLPPHRPTGARRWLGRLLWRDSGGKRVSNMVVFVIITALVIYIDGVIATGYLVVYGSKFIGS
jgi:hypothetical protein